jgi:hypothetical protein
VQPDKKKLVCHGSKIPHLAVSSLQRAADKRNSTTPASVPKSRGSAVRKAGRKESGNLPTSSDGITSAKDELCLEITPNFNFSSGAEHLNVSSGQREAS